MKFHFFANTVDISAKNIADLSAVLDDAGYESFLQTYHSQNPEAMLLSARELRADQRIKYMIALRTPTLSPEFCSRLIYAFNQIQSDRLMINVLHGTLNPEETWDGLVDSEVVVGSRESVLSHTEKFIKILKNTLLFRASPVPLILSGASQDTIDMAAEHCDYLAIDYDNFIQIKLRAEPTEPRTLDLVKNFIVLADVAILDSDQDAALFKDLAGNLSNNLICGTEESVLNEINKLVSYGVNDLLVAHHPNAPYPDRLHDLVKNIANQLDIL